MRNYGALFRYHLAGDVLLLSCYHYCYCYLRATENESFLCVSPPGVENRTIPYGRRRKSIKIIPIQRPRKIHYDDAATANVRKTRFHTFVSAIFFIFVIFSSSPPRPRHHRRGVSLVPETDRFFIMHPHVR